MIFWLGTDMVFDLVAVTSKNHMSCGLEDTRLTSTVTAIAAAYPRKRTRAVRDLRLLEILQIARTRKSAVRVMKYARSSLQMRPAMNVSHLPLIESHHVMSRSQI